MDMEMDLRDLEKWIFKELKIDLSAYKSNQMNRRLTNIVSRNGANSVSEYIKMLEKRPELKEMLSDFITINVSEFFRNKELFQDLEQKIKLILLKENRKLNIWSAACSNGAEPYSLAIILNRISPDLRHYILGTDIDSTILERAKKGEYTASDVKNIDRNTINKYFTSDSERYLINQNIKDRVNFKKHDLILDRYDSGFDLILCRNVVIYFTSEIKDKIYKRFYESLNPNGLLFVGATESIYNYREYGFEKVSTFIYQKKK